VAYIDKSTAKVKLWVGMPEGEENQVWYNYKSENSQSTGYIIKKMKRRILEQRLGGYFQIAMFYENGIKIEEIKPLNLLK
jgi:hypothetical protein